MRSELPEPSTFSLVAEEIMSRQATVNVGTMGHVAHGKTTIVNATTGVSTVRDYSSPLHMVIVRSFDINKPGTELRHERGRAGRPHTQRCIEAGTADKVLLGLLQGAKMGESVIPV